MTGTQIGTCGKNEQGRAGECLGREEEEEGWTERVREVGRTKIKGNVRKMPGGNHEHP